MTIRIGAIIAALLWGLSALALLGGFNIGVSGWATLAVGTSIGIIDCLNRIAERIGGDAE